MLYRNYYILLGLLLCFIGCKLDNSTVDKPNILILVADDLAMHAIHGLGNKNIITPNIDQLIDRGIFFNNAYNAGSPNEQVDQFSQQMFFSGQHFLNSNKSTKTFPSLFQDAGYDTFYTGKWQGSEKEFLANFESAKNVFLGKEHYIEDGGHDTPIVHHLENGILKETKSNKYSSITFTNSVIDFLWEENKSNPFLVVATFTAPHRPYMAPEAFTALYEDAKIKLPKNFQPAHSFDNGALDVKEEIIHTRPLNEEWVLQDIQAYYAMISELDAQIGRILTALKLTKLDKKTIVILMSDNGIALGQHGLMGKQNLYKHSTNIPLIFSGPGIRVNTKSETSCYIHDIYPTICDLAKIEIPKNIDGVSFAETFKNPDKVIRKNLLLAYGNSQRSFLAADNWKLIKYFVGEKEKVQLFDLIEDPLELNDLSKQPIFRKKLQQMSDSLVVQMAKNNDSMMELDMELQYRGNKKSPEVAIISPAPNATIHYTIDGSIPTINSRRYYQPFKVVSLNGIESEATQVKAAVFVGNQMIGEVAEIEIKPKQPTAELISN